MKPGSLQRVSDRHVARQKSSAQRALAQSPSTAHGEPFARPPGRAAWQKPICAFVDLAARVDWTRCDRDVKACAEAMNALIVARGDRGCDTIAPYAEGASRVPGHLLQACRAIAAKDPSACPHPEAQPQNHWVRVERRFEAHVLGSGDRPRLLVGGLAGAPSACELTMTVAQGGRVLWRGRTLMALRTPTLLYVYEAELPKSADPGLAEAQVDAFCIPTVPW